jgi:transposase
MSKHSITEYFPFTRVKITKQHVNLKENPHAIIQMEPDKRYHPLCHVCGSTSNTIHSKNHRRFIRDLNMTEAKVFLQVEYRKIFCDKCDKNRVEKLSFADASKRVTYRMARYIYDLCKVMTVKEVAQHLDLDPKTVKQIDKEFLEIDFGNTDTDNLRILMIDEIAVRKGHQYMTVVADYFTGRVVWMGSNRDKKTLDKFFGIMSKKQKEAIEAVAMDMWEPFINRVRYHCPKAKIVFDFFHVVQGFGRVIDKVRRDEYKKATEQQRKVIKGSRYLLLKNEDNLTEKQKDRLDAILKLNSNLNILYVLKDQLKMLYYYSDREKVKTTLDDWCKMAGQIDHPAVNRFIKRLRFFEYGILDHADYPIGTSELEGINNKIKVIKRKAYGFHDPRYFALKVKQAFNG